MLEYINTLMIYLYVLISLYSWILKYRPDLIKGVVLIDISLRMLHTKKQNPLQRPFTSLIQTGNIYVCKCMYSIYRLT